MNLFRRRSVAALQAEVLTDKSLKRALGPVNLTALGIGAIIGAGIFTLTGEAAASYAGPAIVYSFILGGILCALAGLCYAEMAAMIPVALSRGPGAANRATMAVVIVGGQTLCLLITLLIVPVAYSLFDDAGQWFNRRFRAR